MNTADQFDSEIAKYLETARSLKEQRNSQIPLISRIPSEILAIIFESLASTGRNEAPPSRRHRYPSERSSSDYHPCENVTRVCRTWRMLALGMSSIWGVFYSDCSQKWMDYVVTERLKVTSPISIRASQNRQGHGRDILALRLDPKQFQDLDILLETRGSMSLMHEVLASKNLTALETACMSLDRSMTWRLGDWKGFVWTAYAPRLRVLHLQHILLEVRVSSFPVLQEFSLDLLSCQLYIHSLELLNVLNAMPQLRSFECIGKLDPYNEKPIPEDLQVKLPRLERLTLSEFRWKDLIILDHITSRPLIASSIELSAYEDPVTPNMQPMWKLLPPSSSPLGSWHTILHKKMLYDDEDFGLMLQISSPSPEFRFELATRFKFRPREAVKMRTNQHVEAHICASLPSVYKPDVVALASQRNPGPSRSLKRFTLDMAEVEEFHFLNLTELLEVLMPGQHLEGVHPPLPNAAAIATKSKSKRLKSKPENGLKLSSFPIYLPGLRRIVVVQKAELGNSLNVILFYLGQIFLKRTKRGLPIMVMKLGGRLSLSAEQRELVGDGVDTQVSSINEDDCKYYLSTSLKELPKHLC